MINVFLDESGTFRGGPEPCFVLGSFVVNDPKRTKRAFKKWQSAKFPKILRRKREVKFTDRNLTEELRIKTLLHISNLDIRIFYTHLKKKNVPADYRSKDGTKLKLTGHLYAQVVTQTIGLMLPTADKELRVWRDQRGLQGISLQDFDITVEAGIRPKLNASALFKMDAVNSIDNTNVQLADWICGALGRYHNKRRNGEKYYEILKNSIVSDKELFPDYWSHK